MASWVVVPCLKKLRDDITALAPERSTESDGSVADALHSPGSDHTPDEISDALRGKDADNINEVHAIDVTADLRANGFTMETVVQHIVWRCRSGAENRLRYIIYNRRIWAASSGWVQQTYTGPNPHNKHAHFSASYISAREASTASWYLEDIPMALSNADKVWLTAQLAGMKREILAEVNELVGDTVPRWDTAGNRIPDTDPNPRMTLANATFYVGSALTQVRNAVLKLTEGSTSK